MVNRAIYNYNIYTRLMAGGPIVKTRNDLALILMWNEFYIPVPPPKY